MMRAWLPLSAQYTIFDTRTPFEHCTHFIDGLQKRNVTFGGSEAFGTNNDVITRHSGHGPSIRTPWTFAVYAQLF